MTSTITRTETGFYARVEGGSCSGTYAQVTQFLTEIGYTAEQLATEALYEGGGRGTGF